MFCKIDDINIPLVSTGTSPFIGAGQFGDKAFEWRSKFLNHPKSIIRILEASYVEGARGVEAIPFGRIIEAAQVMSDKYSDYVITGSTYPGKNSGIDDLVKAGAKLIFVHGMISDNKSPKLKKLLDQISSNGIIPGVATHEPIPTIKYCIENSLNVKAFLIPFNANGTMMGNAKKLEEIVDKTNNYHFIGMKTLAAGRIEPKVAFKYIINHNISAVTIGMVTRSQAQESTRVALNALNNKSGR